MNAKAPLSEYLVLSRGQWDASVSKEDIQHAIDAFYLWHERMVAEGKMRVGSRLMKESRFVSKRSIVDGPYTEAKEVVGGYWIIQVKSREEALEWASRIPGRDNEMVEVRRMMEITDFPADVQEKFKQFEQQAAEGA